MGESSLAASCHLPPAPLTQTNTKLETAEHDSQIYTAQRLPFLPDSVGGSTLLLVQKCGPLLQFLPNPSLSLSSFHTQLLCFHSLRAAVRGILAVAALA